MAPDYIRGFDRRQRDVAWSMPDGELGLRDRLPQGRPRRGGVPPGRRKRGDKGGAVSGEVGAGLTGAGPRRAKAGGTCKRTWTGLWGATQADKMVRLGRALGSVALLEVLWWDRLKKVGAHPEPTTRRN